MYCSNLLVEIPGEVDLPEIPGVIRTIRIVVALKLHERKDIEPAGQQ